MLIVDVVPPLLKSLRISRSPTVCTPLKPVPSPSLARVTVVLEEPEPLLGVAAVVIAVGAEVEDVTGGRRGRAVVTGGLGVAGGEGVLEVVLVGQPAGWSFHAQGVRSIGSLSRRR